MTSPLSPPSARTTYLTQEGAEEADCCLIRVHSQQRLLEVLLETSMTVPLPIWTSGIWQIKEFHQVIPRSRQVHE